MPAIAASDVTTTVEDRSIQGAPAKRRNRIKITFGDGALTYPSGGVPLPAAAKFGLVRNLDYLILSDPDDSNGIYWKYDQDNKKLRAYEQNVRTGSTVAADSTSGALAEDESGAETTLRAMGTAIDVDVKLGFLKEVPTTFAPAAQTLFAEAVGW